jgi:hypothetical protein
MWCIFKESTGSQPNVWIRELNSGSLGLFLHRKTISSGDRRGKLANMDYFSENHLLLFSSALFTHDSYLVFYAFILVIGFCSADQHQMRNDTQWSRSLGNLLLLYSRRNNLVGWRPAILQLNRYKQNWLPMVMFSYHRWSPHCRSSETLIASMVLVLAKTRISDSNFKPTSSCFALSKWLLRTSVANASAAICFLSSWIATTF